MRKHGLVSAVLAGATIIVVAGCSGVPSGTTPDVPGASTGGPGATSMAHSAAPVTSSMPSDRPSERQRQRQSEQPSERQSQRHSEQPSEGQGGAPVSSWNPGATANANAFVKANSLPFPVAVGNTWVYRTTVDGTTGRTTNRIVAAGAGAAGYQVTVNSTTEVGGEVSTVPLVYTFYPDGTVSYPVPLVAGLSVVGGGIRWPDAADLASGRTYRSTVRILVSQTGEYEIANVTVRGAGTASVSVPAGTYQASVVDITITAKVGSVQVSTWIAQGVGPVQTAALIQAAGMTEYSITNVLMTFTKGTPGIGS
jgi:hypothetical protein